MMTEQEVRSEKREEKSEKASGNPPAAVSLRQRIMESIEEERLARDVRMGPVKMRPRTLDNWSYSLVAQAKKAYQKALYGQRLAAVKALLQLAAETTEALEDRIDAEAEAGTEVLAEAIKQVTEQTANVKGKTGDGTTLAASGTDVACNVPTGNKTADAAGTAPAAESESSILITQINQS